MAETQNNLVLLPEVRLSFPHIAEPQKQKKEDGSERISYNAEFIMGPSHPGWAKFFEVVNKMAAEKWTVNAGNVMQLIQADRKKRCFGWGQEKINGKTFQPYDGYEGKVFISVGRDTMPQIIDAQGNPIDPANVAQCQALARKMYCGCWVNAAVKPWLQENKHGRGIRCDFVAIQFLRDDTPFGEGHVDVTGVFGAVAQPEPSNAWMGQTAPGAPPTMPPAPFPAAAPPPAWAPPAMPGAPAGLPSFFSR